MTQRKANALIGALCWLVLGAGIMWISYADAAGSVWRKSGLSIALFVLVGALGAAALGRTRDEAAMTIFGPGLLWGLGFGAISTLGYLLFLREWGPGGVLVVSGVTFGLVAGTAFGLLTYLRPEQARGGAGMRGALGALAGVAFVALLMAPQLLVPSWRTDITLGEPLQYLMMFVPLGLLAGALSSILTDRPVLGRS